MSAVMSKPEAAKIDDFALLFPKQTPDPCTGVFEIGLVLGGTVSAGCFTAGVLDFLIEALDAWTLQKQAPTNSGDTVPNHRVVIRVISGASGGGVTAAVFAKAITRAFAPVRAGTDQEGKQNPLYDLWVNNFNLDDFLRDDDLRGGGPVKSALNPAPIDIAADKLIRFTGDDLGAHQTPLLRDYVPKKLTLFLTLTNLRGVPYQVQVGDEGQYQNFLNHGDYVRLAVRTRVDGPADNHEDCAPFRVFDVRPDEFEVSDVHKGGNVLTWKSASEFAKATGAFPVGFPARELVRPSSHYNYRVVAHPLRGVVRLEPDWEKLNQDLEVRNGAYRFLAVDGGAINNAPIELARTFLAGHLGRNSPKGDVAKRAVILIDPFADEARLGPKDFKGIFGAFGSLLKSWLDQARYSTADLALAGDQENFSRFMISPTRVTPTGLLTGGRAIASAALGGFMGFLDKRYRHHDFMLGRAVCQEFLSETFTLPPGNDLFAGWRNTLAFQDQRDEDKKEVRIIPLVSAAVKDSLWHTVPMWPSDLLDFDVLHEKFKKRVAAVIGALKDENVKGIGARLWFWLAESKIRDEATKSLVERVEKDAKDWELQSDARRVS